MQGTRIENKLFTVSGSSSNTTTVTLQSQYTRWYTPWNSSMFTILCSTELWLPTTNTISASAVVQYEIRA